MKTRCFWVWTLVATCGCASQLEKDEGLGVLRPLNPLPCKAGILVSVEPKGGILLGQRQELERIVALSIKEAADSVGAFVQSEIGDGDGKTDVLISAKVTPHNPGSLPKDEKQVGLGILSSCLWLAAGIPGWFIPDRTFQPVLQTTLDVKQLGRGSGLEPTRVAKPADLPVSLSFFERASWGQYFMQLIVPPVFVPSNSDRTQGSLVAETLEDLQVQVAYLVKRELPIQMSKSSDAVLFNNGSSSSTGEWILFAVDSIVNNGGLVCKDADGTPLVVDAAKAQFRNARDNRGNDRGAYLERLLSHLKQLAGDDTNSKARLPTLPDLMARFKHVYAFDRSSLTDASSKEASILEVKLNNASTTMWTLSAPKASVAPKPEGSSKAIARLDGGVPRGN